MPCRVFRYLGFGPAHARMQACILIPVGIIAYTVTGGLKATFISSYIHTVIIYVVLCLFCFLVYSPGSVPQLGSPAKVRFIVLAFLTC